MREPFRFLPARRGFQFAFSNAVGSPLDQGDVGVVGEAVEEGGDTGGIGEDGVPVFESFVGGQQDGISFVAVVDNFKEQVGGMGVVSQVPTFVDHQKSGARIE